MAKASQKVCGQLTERSPFPVVSHNIIWHSTASFPFARFIIWPDDSQAQEYLTREIKKEFVRKYIPRLWFLNQLHKVAETLYNFNQIKSSKDGLILSTSDTEGIKAISTIMEANRNQYKLM